MDDVVDDIKLLSLKLAHLGLSDQAEAATSVVATISDENQRRASKQRLSLLMKARTLLDDLQTELGNNHEISGSLARINYEIKLEIGG